VPARRIKKGTTLAEVAAIVSEALHAAGITATLSGGSAVALYTDGRYHSDDLDFVTAAMLDDLKRTLEPLGFIHAGNPRRSVFEHPSCQWYLEFPPAPLGFGGTYVDASDCAVLRTEFGSIRIITPTQSVMDRLMAAASWQDLPSLEQAVMVAERQAERVDWKQIQDWASREGIASSPAVLEFYRKLKRAVPSD